MTDTPTGQEKLPPKLYHYCDGEGFKGILDSNCMWLSHISGMNDYAEGYWFIDFFNKYANTKQGKPSIQSSVFADTFGNYDPFITCFTEDGDSLAQWWAYGDDGCGYAIGFNPRCFPCQVSKPIPTTNAEEFHCLHQVEYDLEVHKKEADYILNECENLTGTSLGLKIATTLLSHCLVAKNSAFHVEQEWRIVRYHSQLGQHETKLKHLGWRQTKYGLVPYLEMPFDSEGESPIVEIVLGPKNPVNIRMLKMFLDKHGFGNATIVRSGASYR